jgi:hypothetical protein
MERMVHVLEYGIWAEVRAEILLGKRLSRNCRRDRVGARGAPHSHILTLTGGTNSDSD